MKKGDTARLDATWWKKNKSIRLRSKTFDGLMAEYLDQKKMADKLGDDAEAYRLALNLALKAGREAKALVGKCGRGQDETKSVLEGYVKLFAAEAKKMNDKHTAAEKSSRKADGKLAAIEAEIKKYSNEVAKISKQVTVLESNTDAWVAKVGKKQAITNCRTLWEGMEKLDGKFDDCGQDLSKFEKSGDIRSVDNAAKRIETAKKLCMQLRGLTARAQANIIGVERKVKETADAG